MDINKHNNNNEHDTKIIIFELNIESSSLNLEQLDKTGP